MIRLRHWEYWPFLVVYWPVFFYWIWLSVRARSLFYFSAANPSIENGGMLGESKIKILDLIPQNLKPHTVYVEQNKQFEEVKQVVNTLLSYPIICKPDVGERGWKVEKIKNEDELNQYHHNIHVPYLIQDCLKEELEMGVFYYRFPKEKSGIVSSIVIKKMLSITGNGISTIEQLILSNDRAKLQWEILRERYKSRLSDILNDGEELELVSIGNHSRGTQFLSGNHLINDQLHSVFDKISNNIKGFYFGRFDIKVNSVSDLYRGNIKIMELNGAGSEPAHIYDPKFTLLKAYEAIFHHWKVLFKISVENHRKGVPYLSFADAWKEYRKIKAIQK